MWNESQEQLKPLRTGLTTGACATACVVGAANYIFFDRSCEQVTVCLPRGQQVVLNLFGYLGFAQGVQVSTVKDAGDDPDITHGAEIFVRLSLMQTPGVCFAAEAGVGTVTAPGLSLPIGEPAINPVPRQMIETHLERISKTANYAGGFRVGVGVQHGEALAKKTMNARLGIMGGLSILGTTGIVRPYSCGAWIASIYQSIQVAKANGLMHVAATTGNTSEACVRQVYGLNDMAIIEMGDFAGAVFKQMRKDPIERLTICAGFGKLSKLALGHVDLHSRSSQIDFSALACMALKLGAGADLCGQIQAANTSLEALTLAHGAGIALGNEICKHANSFAASKLPNLVQVEVIAVDRSGRIVGRWPNPELL